MTALRVYRALLANRAVTRLLAGEFVSGVGDWLYVVALLLLVYERTSDPVLLGIVGAARVLPYVFLSIPAGIVSDRYDRRMVLLVTDVARGVIMLAMAAVVLAEGPIALIIALAILATCFSSFFRPALGSYLPSLVRDESELGPANSARFSLENLAFVAGPAIAGILVETSGLAPAFIINAATFGFVAAILSSLPPSWARPPAPTSADPAEAREPAEGEPSDRSGGLRPYARQLSGLGVANVAGGVAFGGLAVLTVILAVDHLAAGPTAAGYLNAAIGLGGLLGAVGSGVLVLRRNLGPPIVAAGAIFGGGLGLLGVAPALPGAVAFASAAVGIAAAGSVILDVLTTTVFQRVVPDELRGRALGWISTAGVLSFSIGSVAYPPIVELVGPAPVLVLSGVLLSVASLGTVALVRDALGRTPALEAALERIRGLEIFAVVPAARLDASLRRFRSVDVAAGTAVIEEGQPADRFYVIAEGRFAVSQRGPDGLDRHLRTLGPDEVFGEIGLLTGAPRTATVAAETSGHLLALDGTDFLELVGAEPGLGERLLELRRGPASLPGAATGRGI